MSQAPTVKSELNKLRHNQQFMAIAILLFASVMVWVAFGLFSSQKSTRVTSQQKQQAQPLTPTLDTTVLDTLEGKTYFSESELESFTIYQLVSAEDGVFERAVPIGTDLSTLEPEETDDTAIVPSLLEDEVLAADGEASESALPTPSPSPESEATATDSANINVP